MYIATGIIYIVATSVCINIIYTLSYGLKSTTLLYRSRYSTRWDLHKDSRRPSSSAPASHSGSGSHPEGCRLHGHQTFWRLPKSLDRRMDRKEEWYMWSEVCGMWWVSESLSNLVPPRWADPIRTHVSVISKQTWGEALIRRGKRKEGRKADRKEGQKQACGSPVLRWKASTKSFRLFTSTGSTPEVCRDGGRGDFGHTRDMMRSLTTRSTSSILSLVWTTGGDIGLS